MNRKNLALRVLLSPAIAGFAVLVGLAAGAAQAVPITVLNSSFESPDVPQFNGGPITSWEQSGGNSGVFQPNAFQPATPAQPPDVGLAFTAGVFGTQTAYIQGGTEYIQQALGVNLQEGTYTLRVNVGDRKDTPAPNYTVYLLSAGAVTLASVNQTNFAPPDAGEGGWIESLLTFTALSTDTHLGLEIGIRLQSAGGGQVNFDNVRLDFVAAPAGPAPVPEPATLALLGLGLAGLGFGRRKRQV